jgi:hypothetical protein
VPAAAGYEFVVKLESATVLRLRVPRMPLYRADEVIE